MSFQDRSMVPKPTFPSEKISRSSVQSVPPVLPTLQGQSDVDCLLQVLISEGSRFLKGEVMLCLFTPYRSLGIQHVVTGALL